jgi:hypothetical protein
VWATVSVPWVVKRKPMPWWKPTAASRMAIPKVPRISTYTPILEMLPSNLTPAALTIVWTASRSGAKNRIVLGSAALRLVPQRLGAVRPLRWQAPTKQQPGSPRSPPTRAVVLNFGTAPFPLCPLFGNGVEPRLRWRRPPARHRDHLRNPLAARCVAGPPWLRPWSAAGRGSPSFGVARLPCCAVTGHLQLHHRCEQPVQTAWGRRPGGTPRWNLRAHSGSARAVVGKRSVRRLHATLSRGSSERSRTP